jgi:DNA-binding beta-propeller fold protein YncE
MIVRKERRGVLAAGFVAILAALSPASATSEAPVAGKAAAATPAPGAVTDVMLPGAPADGLTLDYLAVDRGRKRVWVPAAGTGKVMVIDADTRTVHAIEGFKTAEVERNGRKRVVGPSSATIGDGVVYVGNRADSNVCAIDAATLARGACVTLDSPPDGVAYVASMKEVWVTTPRDQSITILDVTSPKAPKTAGRIALEGDPEGYAVDDAGGFFYTNYEDKDKTLRISIAARKVVATWEPKCGEAGPRGLALDGDRRFLLVACTDHLQVLAVADGHALATLPTGAGVDNLDFLPSRRAVYAAASGDAKLTVATLDDKGALQQTASVPTVKGARNAVVTDDGTVWIADGPEGKVLVVRPGS